MGKNSAIEWTDHTFNPWHGCVKVSPGCKNCYAERDSKRFGFDIFGADKERRFLSDDNWDKPLKWNRKAEKEGVRYKVFCGSMCDVFEKHANSEINEKMNFLRRVLWLTIGDTPYLDWLLLTKRPENIMRLGSAFWDAHQRLPNNVWIGTSVENQEQADKRIPELLKIPAKVRFLSCEPLLEKIDLGKWLWSSPSPDIDWVIAGGESGSNARPMHPDWAGSLRDQCIEAGVPFFMKQMTKKAQIPDELFIREFPTILSEES